MRHQMKCPGHALARTTGANEEIQMQSNFQPQIYATCSELQTRRVGNRCGLSQARAHLVASIFFGEVPL